MVIGTLLTLKTHVLLLVCVGQTVLKHTVDERLVTELGTGTHVGEIMGSVGHGLSTTGNDNVGGSSQDGLGGNNDGLDTRGAHLVDGGADDGFLETSAECALTGRVLAEADSGQILTWADKWW